MRQVFTSQRLETVEGVARLLEQAGIAVHISHARSYRSCRSGQFSYSDPTPAHQQPGVWVRRAEDQPRARELLREAGLMATTRSYSGLPQTAADALPMPSVDGRRRWTWRIRIGLLLVIAAVAVLLWMGRRPPQTAAPTVAPASTPAAAPAPASADEESGEEVIRVRLAPPPVDPAR